MRKSSTNYREECIVLRKRLKAITDTAKSIHIQAFAAEWHCQRLEYNETFQRVKLIQELSKEIEKETK